MLNLIDQYRRYPNAENARVLREYFERNPSRMWLLQDEDLLFSQPFCSDHTIASVLERNGTEQSQTVPTTSSRARRGDPGAARRSAFFRTAMTRLRSYFVNDAQLAPSGSSWRD